MPEYINVKPKLTNLKHTVSASFELNDKTKTTQIFPT